MATIVTDAIAFWYDSKDWRGNDDYDGERDIAGFERVDSVAIGKLSARYILG